MFVCLSHIQHDQNSQGYAPPFENDPYANNGSIATSRQRGGGGGDDDIFNDNDEFTAVLERSVRSHNDQSFQYNNRNANHRQQRGGGRDRDGIPRDINVEPRRSRGHNRSSGGGSRRRSNGGNAQQQHPDDDATSVTTSRTSFSRQSAVNRLER